MQFSGESTVMERGGKKNTNQTKPKQKISEEKLELSYEALDCPVSSCWDNFF